MEFHTYFPELHLQVPMDTEQDYANYISRLAAFKRYVEGHIEIMRLGLRDGQVPPRVTLAGVEDSLRPHIVDDPEQSQLYKPFEQFPTAISPGAAERFKKEASWPSGIRSCPVTRRCCVFVQKEYLPAARETIAAADLPDGREYYRLCIRHFTTLDLTPEEVHQTGLDEVQRIRAEMQAVIHQIGFRGRFQSLHRLPAQRPALLRHHPRRPCWKRPPWC